jgi:hypothetical protein
MIMGLRVTGMRMDIFVRTPVISRLSLRAFPSLDLELSKGLMDTVAPSLCSSLLLIRTIQRTKMGPNARPWFNSSTPLIANFTTYELCTICKKSVVQASSHR